MQQLQNNSITDLITQTGLTKDTASSLKDAFMPYFDQAKEWEEKAKSLVVTSEDQKEQMKQAREARLILKNIRVDVEKTRKQLKEDSLRKGKAIDGIANVIKYLITPIEEHLQEQEDFVKIQEAKRKAQLAEDRAKELEPYGVETQFLNLADMSDEVWGDYFSGVKARHQAQIEAERKAEEERLENIRLDNLERERRLEIAPFAQFVDSAPDLRAMDQDSFSNLMKSLRQAKSKYDKEQEDIRKENERLRKEAEEKAKQEQERIKKEQAERKAREENARKEREEHEKKMAEERKRREEAEAKLKAEQERKEQESRKEAEAKRQAELSPDKDKLSALAQAVDSIEIPILKDAAAKKIAEQAKELLSKVSAHIRDKSKSI